MKRVAILGAGSWGTSLAVHAVRCGHRVQLWGRNSEVLDSLNEKGENPVYFPNEVLFAKPPAKEQFRASADANQALEQADVVLFAVPSSAMRETARRVAAVCPRNAVAISTAKGLETGTLKFMCAVLVDELGGRERVGALAGPSFALEVLRNYPTAVTCASHADSTTTFTAELLHSDRFRVYTSTDLVGVEVGGVVKNVIAVAAGVVDGMGMGSNTRAALLTRGIAEMQRITVALGGERATVSGLSGLGDLLLTATGDLSRNRRVGLGLGQGKKLPQILEELGQVAESVNTAKNLGELARKHKVSVPIIEQVVELLDGRTTAEKAVETLLSRQPRKEDGEF